MNFFHCPIKIVSRNKGRSAIASSVYISGTRLENTWDGTTHDYTRKQHIIHSEIMLPANASPQYMDRATLWNSVEWNETATPSLPACLRLHIRPIPGKDAELIEMIYEKTGTQLV
jgi:hypothetical protein